MTSRAPRARPSDIGVGANCLIRNAIIDRNARIGAGCRLSPQGLPEKWETDALFVRDGVIVVKKGAVVPPGTVVGNENFRADLLVHLGLPSSSPPLAKGAPPPSRTCSSRAAAAVVPPP